MEMKDLKQGVPGFKRYARSHLGEVFTIATIILAGLSAWKGVAWGTAGWSFFILGIAMIWGVLLPHHADWILRKTYRMITQQSRMWEIAIGIIKLAIALIIPWVIFAIIGILAGEAYHYYTKTHRDGSSFHKAA